MRCFSLAAAALLALSSCDFSPVIDIDVPPHERRLYMTGVIAADSTLLIQVGATRDPYDETEGFYRELSRISASVVLQRDGQPDERLRERMGCQGFFRGEQVDLPCGVYETPTRLRPGETVRFVASADSLPDATATVTLPERPDVVLDEATVGPTTRDEFGNEQREVNISYRLRDAAGANFYALSVLRVLLYDGCDYSTGECVPAVQRFDRHYPFSTTDTAILAGSRSIPDADGFSFVTFDDDLFDGAVQTTRLRATVVDDFAAESQAMPVVLQLAALSPVLYRAYAITSFSLGDENPFVEPAELPSNVENGYGLIGAVTLFEATVAD